MKRRSFLRGAFAVGAAGSLAGCFGIANGPPSRASEVVKRIETKDGRLRIHFEKETLVQSRANPGSARLGFVDDAASTVAELSPVGVARAAKGRGTGKGGRGSAASVPTGRNGRAKYGDTNAPAWWMQHGGEVSEYDTEVKEAGIGFLSPDEAGSEDLPGPGPVPWDRTWRKDDFEGSTLSYDFDRTGWYRFGAHLVAQKGGHDFKWEAIDFRVGEGGDGYAVKNQWKVSPKL